MKRSYLRHVSKKRAVLNRRYSKLRALFLEEHPWCCRCGGLADEVHHAAGRGSGNFLRVETWRAACHDCHVWITEHPREAVARGWSLPRVALVPVDGVERAG